MAHFLTETQTGFMKGRSILHGFHYAQEVITAAAMDKFQMALFKADLNKAFDSIEWAFLMRCLQALHFPPNWRHWIRFLVLQGNSQVILNGVAGRQITLRRGVRQGDPISPYLFNMAIDFLVRWVTRLNQLDLLQAPFPGCRTCLLYADDTMIFLKPMVSQFKILQLILHIFQRLSGLSVNFHKSELLMTVDPDLKIHGLAQIIHCTASKFPIRYLGLPLSNKKSPAAAFQPLLDNIQSRLPG
jgi:Reverse transcriptase (RNA-dependent DNA polymerase)